MCITQEKRCKKKKKGVRVDWFKKIIITILIRKTRENTTFHLATSTECFVLILSFIISSST
jgi:hypothetical protein